MKSERCRSFFLTQLDTVSRCIRFIGVRLAQTVLTNHPLNAGLHRPAPNRRFSSANGTGRALTLTGSDVSIHQPKMSVSLNLAKSVSRRGGRQPVANSALHELRMKSSIFSGGPLSRFHLRRSLCVRWNVEQEPTIRWRCTGFPGVVPRAGRRYR